VNRLLILPTLAVLLSGCSLAAERDVRAYNACISRHPQDMVVCEGPRQAYEVDLPTFQANSAAIRPMPDYGYKVGSALSGPRLRPVPLHPGPISVRLERAGAFPHARNGEGLARYCYSQRLLSAAVEAIG
jgi:hypothetical protein